MSAFLKFHSSNTSFYKANSKNEYFNDKNIRQTETLELQNNFPLIFAKNIIQINKLRECHAYVLEVWSLKIDYVLYRISESESFNGKIVGPKDLLEI